MQDYKFLIINVELVPPKPNELERNMSKCVWVVSGMTFTHDVSSSGSEKLMLPAMKSFFIMSIE